MTLPVLYSDNLMDELDDSALEYSMPLDADSQSFTRTQSSEVLDASNVCPTSYYNSKVSRSIWLTPTT